MGYVQVDALRLHKTLPVFLVRSCQVKSKGYCLHHLALNELHVRYEKLCMQLPCIIEFGFAIKSEQYGILLKTSPEATGCSVNKKQQV
jgi:hypothetical protein